MPEWSCFPFIHGDFGNSFLESGEGEGRKRNGLGSGALVDGPVALRAFSDCSLITQYLWT